MTTMKQVRLLAESGIDAKAACKQLGMSRAKYFRLLKRSGYKRDNGLGRDIPYKIQLTCGHGNPLLEITVSIFTPFVVGCECQEVEL